jgi:SAM-dependent methyltransferase
MSNNKSHWENVYETKSPQEVSWTQEIPEVSLKMIQEITANKDTTIIDVGGGDSKLVDFLLEDGFTNITVLDISQAALERAKKRLGKKAENVAWICSDITEFVPNQTYDFWHDRAAFHFLTSESDRNKYLDLVEKYVAKNLLIASFSETGPLKCSGLDIKQYSFEAVEQFFSNKFDIKTQVSEEHQTPFSTIQNFQYSLFSKKH